MGLEAPGLWGLPRPGLEPVSPALEGGLFAPEPPGSPVVFKTRAHMVVHGQLWAGRPGAQDTAGFDGGMSGVTMSKGGNVQMEQVEGTRAASVRAELEAPLHPDEMSVQQEPGARSCRERPSGALLGQQENSILRPERREPGVGAGAAQTS